MADDADNAQDHMERENVGMLTRHLQPTGPAAMGWCYWCDEKVAYGLRWCVGPACRDQWTREQAAAARNNGRAP